MYSLSVRLSYGSSILLPLPHIHNARMLDMYVFWPSALSLTATYAIASLSFPPVTEMFHFTGFAFLSECRALALRVAPFGYPRLFGYLLLIVAFRSLSRPSSLSTTKASSNRPYYLNYLCACFLMIISNHLELCCITFSFPQKNNAHRSSFLFLLSVSALFYSYLEYKNRS